MIVFIHQLTIGKGRVRKERDFFSAAPRIYRIVSTIASSYAFILDDRDMLHWKMSPLWVILCVDSCGAHCLRLFRKQTRPADLGSILYEALRSGMESDGDLSIDGFLRSLDSDLGEANDQYAGEIMVGLMFGAVMAIERSASARVAEQITSGLKLEFVRHLEEQGANAIQRAEWETILADRFLGYRQCLENYSGFEPPWKLGRQFYWNLVGIEDHVAMLVKISTLYLLAARDRCQDLLNEYGPSVLVR
jgi:hypothetical protein